MQIKIKKVETVSEFIDAIRIRVDVFILEQQCPPGWEPDELDKNAEHFIAVVDGCIRATARFREDPTNVAKIERMVVQKEYRGKGIGESLTKYIIDYAKGKGYKKVWIQAQKKAERFYEKIGFQTISKEYDLWDLGIPHIDMEYNFH